jgi:hypothetical protein
MKNNKEKVTTDEHAEEKKSVTTSAPSSIRETDNDMTDRLFKNTDINISREKLKSVFNHLSLPLNEFANKLESMTPEEMRIEAILLSHLPTYRGPRPKVNIATEEEFNKVMTIFEKRWDNMYPGKRYPESRRSLNFRVRKMICIIGGVNRTVRLINFVFRNWSNLQKEFPWRLGKSPNMRLILADWEYTPWSQRKRIRNRIQLLKRFGVNL